MSDKRKIKVVSGVTLKVNLGNYETLEVIKSVETDIEFESREELAEKSANLNRLVTTLVKDAVDQGCEDMKRERCFKLGSQDIPVSTWSFARAEAKNKVS